MSSTKYILDLPYSILLELYKILDINGQWEQLGASIGFTGNEMAWFRTAFQRNSRPTEELLHKWSHCNPVAEELFNHLLDIGQYRACELLRGEVPESCFRQMEEKKMRGRGHNQRDLPVKQLPGNDDNDDRLSSGLPRPRLPPYNSNQPSSHHMQMNSSETSLPPYQSVQTSNNSMACGGLTPDYSRDSPYNNSNHGDPSHPPKSWSSVKKEPVESTTCDSTELSKTNLVNPCVSPTGLSPDSNVRLSGTDNADMLQAALFSTPRYSLQELTQLTDDFSLPLVLGQGGFGTVYKGRIQKLQMDVAVKKLNKTDNYEEIKALFMYHHPNIIELHGYCNDQGVLLLIYPYMENGSLDNRIICKNKTPPLTWGQRVNILYGTAKALHYLHHSHKRPMIHGDLKSPNILLDRHMEAKVADFGLAKHATSGTSSKSKLTHVSQYDPKIYGSRAYLPDEYLKDTSQLHISTDIFGFGVVMFEMCTGVKAGDAKLLSKGEYKLLKDLMNTYRDVTDLDILIKTRDPQCSDWPRNQWKEVLDLGLSCTHALKKRRPDSAKVLEKLQTIHAKKTQSAKQKEPRTTVNGNRYPQSISGSERSDNISFDSQGHGVSLTNPNRQMDITDRLNRMRLRDHPLEPIPSLPCPDPCGHKTAADYVNVQSKSDKNPDHGYNPDHVKSGKNPSSCLQKSPVNIYSPGGITSFPNKTVFVPKDPDDLPYDKRKLEDPTVSSMESESLKYEPSETDANDPRWLGYDSKKLSDPESVISPSSPDIKQHKGSLESSVAVSDDIYREMLHENEAWMMQDYYDKQSKLQEDPADRCGEAVQQSFGDVSTDSGSGSDSLGEIASPKIKGSKPNNYVVMPTAPAKPKRVKCAPPPPAAPPPSENSTGDFGVTTSSLDRLNSAPLSEINTTSHDSDHIYENAPVATTAANNTKLPDSLYLAKKSEEGVSVRGKPSELHSSSSRESSAGRQHISYNEGSAQGGLYITPEQFGHEGDGTSLAAAARETSPNRNMVSHGDSTNSSEQIKQKRQKKLPGFLLNYAED